MPLVSIHLFERYLNSVLKFGHIGEGDDHPVPFRGGSHHCKHGRGQGENFLGTVGVKGPVLGPRLNHFPEVLADPVFLALGLSCLDPLFA